MLYTYEIYAASSNQLLKRLQFRNQAEIELELEEYLQTITESVRIRKQFGRTFTWTDWKCEEEDTGSGGGNGQDHPLAESVQSFNNGKILYLPFIVEAGQTSFSLPSNFLPIGMLQVFLVGYNKVHASLVRIEDDNKLLINQDLETGLGFSIDQGDRIELYNFKI